MTSPLTSPKRARSKSTALTVASSPSSAAISSSCALMSRQAFATAWPMKTVERLAEVCRSNGTAAVSPMTTLTQSTGMPSSWAATCAITVRAP